MGDKFMTEGADRLIRQAHCEYVRLMVSCGVQWLEIHEWEK
jgi:hypothetical protein